MNDVNITLQEEFIKLRLHSIRKSKGLTQSELANKTGLSVATISNIESNCNCNLNSLIHYVDALGYDINIDKKVEKDDSEGSNQDVPDGGTE